MLKYKIPQIVTFTLYFQRISYKFNEVLIINKHKKSRSCGLTRTGICLSSNIEWPMSDSLFGYDLYIPQV